MYMVKTDDETISTHETLVEAVKTAEELDRQEEAKGDDGRMVYVYLDYPSKLYGTDDTMIWVGEGKGLTREGKRYAEMEG